MLTFVEGASLGLHIPGYHESIICLCSMHYGFWSFPAKEPYNLWLICGKWRTAFCGSSPPSHGVSVYDIICIYWRSAFSETLPLRAVRGRQQHWQSLICCNFYALSHSSNNVNFEFGFGKSVHNSLELFKCHKNGSAWVLMAMHFVCKCRKHLVATNGATV